MRNVKRWLASLLCAGLLCQMTVLPAFADAGMEETLAKGTAQTDEELETENGWSLADLKTQFPEGRYWNHADNPGNNDPMHTSTKPCPWHDKKVGYNSNTCNHPDFGHYYCCWGYADQLGYLYSGSNPEKWTKLEGTSATNYIDNLKTGDIVRFRFNSGAKHSVFVTSVTNNRVYYTDCNQGGKCEISWSHSQTKAYFRENNRVLWVQVCPGGPGPGPDPDPNVDALGCTTAYAGWYQETSRGGANVNSRHSKNWGDQVGVIGKGEYVYVSKATGTGSGNLGHILYNGVERYIAMGLFKRVNDRTGDPFGALDGCIPEEGGFRLIGWALDWDAPYTALQINVYLDGQLVLQGKADAQRTDLNQNIAGDIGDYHGYNLWIPTDKTGEHSYSVYAINEGAGSHACIKEGTVNLPVRDKDGPVISDVKVTNVTNKGYDVSCKVTDPSGVDRVMFPTWTTANGQDDLLRDWNTNPKARGTQNGDTWTFHVDIADHNNEGGEYCTDIHAYDKYGNASSLGAPRISVDTEAPVISNVKVSNITTEGYDVSCTVTDNVGVNRVVFPTWTVLNDQDDLAAAWWDVDHTATRGTRNDDTWSFHVNIADHNNERGAYLTHIYAYDDAGNRSAVGSEIGKIIVPEPYPTITFDACGGRAEFTEKQLERNADGMHYGALPEAWMDGYVFDGWYTDAVDGTRVSRTTAYTAEGNTTLYAHWTPVASDAEQGWSLQDGTLVITAQGAMQDYDSAAQTPWFKDRAEIRKIVVQQGVTTIGDYAFYGCENVTSVTLPDTVTQIGKLAFYGCKALRTLTVPDSVLVVEDYAFAKAGLQSIVFRGSAPVLGAGIFAGLNAEVRYPAEAAGWTEEVRQSYTGSVNWLGVGAAALAAEESELQLEDPVLASLLADSCV